MRVESPTVRHLLFRMVAGGAGYVCRAALRAVITGLVFAACLLLAMSYVGVRLPDAFELLDKIESVSQLSKVLS